MGLRSFFHKIKIGFSRMGESLILYKNKLFAIEIKRWKGHLVEREGDFIQYKRDRWTDETHTKVHKSPFKQIGRAIYLLRKVNPENAWINSIVFFEGADRIETNNDNVWFDNIDNLIYHIQNDGKISWDNNAEKFFGRCIAADYLYCHSWGKSLRCIISEESLRFTTPTVILTRKDIESISIVHHWSYDELKIKTLSGRIFNINRENDFIVVNDNGYKYRYAFCKLDYIKLGK